ncbi:MAG: four helix bundle protein [Gemmatimonadota bacterium]
MGHIAGWAGSYRNLLVWQRAMQLGAEINRVAGLMPPHERFEITRQMRTASFSIALNIAEGKGRSTRADFARFLAIARGSAMELSCCLDFVRTLRYVGDEELTRAESLLDEVGRMLTAMLRSLAQPAREKVRSQYLATSD